MGPGVSSRDLEACLMSNEAPADDKVAARVRAAVAGDFQPEHVNGLTMRTDEGSFDLVRFFCYYLIFDFSVFFQTYFLFHRARSTLGPRGLW